MQLQRPELLSVCIKISNQSMNYFEMLLPGCAETMVVEAAQESLARSFRCLKNS
jgi:hypothetical protein